MGELCERLDVRHVELRVADRLDVEQARALRHHSLKSLRTVAVRIADLDAVVCKIAEQRARAAVKTARRHELIALPQHIEHRLRDSRHARCTGHSPGTALQIIDATLQAHERRIADARVDKARLAPRKHLRHILRRLLIECRCLKNRLRRRPRRLIRPKAAVQQACRKSHKTISRP